METPNNLNHQSRTYFLLQGQSISKLNDILNSTIFAHYLRTWFSVIIEIILYLVFIATVILTVMIPTDLSLFIQKENFKFTASIQYEDFANLMLGLKIFILLISLPILAFAILLGRNRKKNNLIRKAFTETQKMKEGFEKAIKELNL